MSSLDETRILRPTVIRDEDEPTVPHAVQPPSEAVTAEHVAGADGSLAARLRAQAQALSNRSREFTVPPRDVWGDDLIVVAKPVKLREGQSYARLVIESTVSVRYRDDDGQVQEIEDGWAGVAKMLGMAGEGVSLGDVVKTVTGSEEALAGLAESIMAFIMGRRSIVEEALGN